MFVTVFQSNIRDEVKAGGTSVWEFTNGVLDFTGEEENRFFGDCRIYCD